MGAGVLGLQSSSGVASLVRDAAMVACEGEWGIGRESSFGCQNTDLVKSVVLMEKFALRVFVCNLCCGMRQCLSDGVC